MYIHEDGLINVSEGIIKQAKKDFIKGGKILYELLKRIPAQKELLEDPDHLTTAYIDDVRWMYDAWRFVSEDPYQFFGDEAAVINAWKSEAIEEYYRVLYLKIAEKIYRANPSTKKIHQLTDAEVINLLQDNKESADYISARDYILKLNRGESIIRSWEVIALGRSRRPIKRKTLSEYHQNLSNQKIENIKKARGLYEEGMGLHEIAKEMELSVYCVKKYLFSS